MDQVKIGAFIAQLRRERGWTQEELGERLGVTNKTISRWENGNYMPSIEMLTLLGKEFGVTLNELLEGRKLDEADFRAAADEKLAQAMARPGERLRRWLERYGTFTAVVLVLCLMIGSLAYVDWQYRQAHPEDVAPLGTFACRDVWYDDSLRWIYLTFAHDGRYFIFDSAGRLFEYGAYDREGDVVRLDSGEDVRWAVVKGERIFDRSPIGEGLMNYGFITAEPVFIDTQFWPPEARSFAGPSGALPNQKNSRFQPEAGVFCKSGISQTRRSGSRPRWRSR